MQAVDDDSGSRISYFVGTPSNYVHLDYRTGSLSLNRNYWRLMQLDKLDLKLGRFKIFFKRKVLPNMPVARKKY